MPYVESTFAAKETTQAYYRNGARQLLAFDKLAAARLDTITTEMIGAYVARRQKAGLQVSSINRELQVHRRMFRLAAEWGKAEKVLPAVKMLPGENHRERVITAEEEKAYLEAASPLVRDVVTILLDCGLRPSECFRLKRENIKDGCLEVLHGKTASARRRIPMSQRVAAIVEMRLAEAEDSEWLFPARTKRGHIEPSTLKKQHVRACQASGIQPFHLYTLRHSCLSRWAPHMDPWTLAYLAGHRDMAVTKRYIHPQQPQIRQAIDRARTISPTVENASSAAVN